MISEEIERGKANEESQMVPGPRTQATWHEAGWGRVNGDKVTVGEVGTANREQLGTKVTTTEAEGLFQNCSLWLTECFGSC